MSKKTRKSISTPTGEMKYGHIAKPNTKFNADGEYSVDLILVPGQPGVDEFVERLSKMAEECKAEILADPQNASKKGAISKYNLHSPLSKELDKDGNETGNWLLKVKQKARVKKKDGTFIEKSINVFDAKLKKLTNPKIGRGSTLKVSFTPVPFVMHATKNVGMTTWFEAVQVINLVEWTGGGDAASYGFGEEEGYEGGDDGSEAFGEQPQETVEPSAAPAAGEGADHQF